MDTIIVEYKRSKSGNWREYDFFTIPENLAPNSCYKAKNKIMQERYGAIHMRSRWNKTFDYPCMYYENPATGEFFRTHHAQLKNQQGPSEKDETWYLFTI